MGANKDSSKESDVMFLAVDVGNSNTTYALVDKGTVLKTHRFETRPHEDAQTIVSLLTSELADALGNVDTLGLSCVVPSLAQSWQMVAQTLGVSFFNIDDMEHIPLALKAEPGERIGADYLATMYAAYKRVGSPVIVVDFGTATNIGVINAHGAFIGGSISPGVHLAASALFEKAALLKDTPLAAPPSPIGTNTVTCLQSGIVIGNACMVEGLVARMKKQLGVSHCPVLATGGLAPLIARETSCFDACVPELTLQGIYLLYQDSAQLSSY